jgi:hypothetical protein
MSFQGRKLVANQGIAQSNEFTRQLAAANTPRESFDMEAKAAANKAYHREQRDFEKTAEDCQNYIQARRNTTKLIAPHIHQGRPSDKNLTSSSGLSDGVKEGRTAVKGVHGGLAHAVRRPGPLSWLLSIA